MNGSSPRSGVDPVAETRLPAQRYLTALGYLAIRSPDIAGWMRFVGDLLGAQAVNDDGDYLQVRMDGRVQRLLIERSAAPFSFAMGFEAVDPAALARLAAVLDGQNVAVTRGDAAEAARRGLTEFIRFRDPDGNRIECYVGQAAATSPFTPGRPIGGFRTGSLGVGHIALSTPRYEEMTEFYRGTLGFALTDFCRAPFEATFLRLNPRHHSVALIHTTRPGIHHLMMEYLHWDDVGRAYDLALQIPNGVGQTLGRHSNDLITSFYVYTPDRFLLELGWAGRLVGDDWQVEELPGPSLWGHDRLWLPEDKRAVARQILGELRNRGLRAPMHAPSDEEVAAGARHEP